MIVVDYRFRPTTWTAAYYDAPLRQAAFDHVNRLIALHGGILDSDDFGRGFEVSGERTPLVNPQSGVFQAPADGASALDPHRVPSPGRAGLV
jgi:hypothetical protein